MKWFFFLSSDFELKNPSKREWIFENKFWVQNFLKKKHILKNSLKLKRWQVDSVCAVKTTIFHFSCEFQKRKFEAKLLKKNLILKHIFFENRVFFKFKTIRFSVQKVYITSDFVSRFPQSVGFWIEFSKMREMLIQLSWSLLAMHLVFSQDLGMFFRFRLICLTFAGVSK